MMTFLTPITTGDIAIYLEIDAFIRAGIQLNPKAKLAYDVVLNFASFVSGLVLEKSEEYNIDTKYTGTGTYVDVEDAIDFGENHNPLAQF